MGDGFLHKYFLNNPSKRLHKWTHYFDIYERHFERFRGQSPVVMEIGVMGGGSLAMWKAYFGPGAKIVGLDVAPECKKHQAEDIEIVIGNQRNSNILGKVKAKYPRIDIVIDDGSHKSMDMIAAFENLYDHLDPRGVYLVEDTHTNYWPDWGGGVRSPGTFMEFCKDKLDELNAVHTREALPVTRFTQSTDFVAFYDSVVVFEKRPQAIRQGLVTIGMAFPSEALTEI